jgi:hypothetical protein
MTGQRCGLDACASPCHDPAAATGAYCAPARCYCLGCPGAVPVDRSRPHRIAAGRRAERVWLNQPAMPIDDALAILHAEAKAAREAGDLGGALQGDTIAPPRLDRRITAGGLQLVAA